jgi:hypothetical protein
MCTVCVRPTAARPHRRTGLGSAAHNWLRPAHKTQPVSTRSVRTARRTRPRARSERLPWHGSRRFTSDYPTAKLRMMSTRALRHGMARSGGHGQTTSRSTRRGVALPATVGDWTAHYEMFMGSIHGPWCACLTWS